MLVMVNRCVYTTIQILVAMLLFGSVYMDYTKEGKFAFSFKLD